MTQSNDYKEGMYLSVFSDCKLTKGYSRTLVNDLTRNQAYMIDNDAYDFLMKCKEDFLKKVIQSYPENEQENVIDLIDYLVGKDICFFTENPASFPELSEDWDNYSIVSNAIIDIDEKIHDFEKIIPQLTELGCYDLQVRVFSNMTSVDLEKIVAIINDSSIKSVEFYLPSSKEFSKTYLKNLTRDFFKIKNLIIHGHSKNEAYLIYPEKFRNNMGNIIFVEQSVNNETHCGAVSPHYFAQDNIQFFAEAKQANTCLNRKMSVDKNGVIKNCPSLVEGFGNVENTAFKEALNSDGFKKLWNITKDEINICRDCEFRNVCTDCRAYIQDENDIHSKPLKCSYNPYKNEWESSVSNEMKIQLESTN